MHRTLFPFLTAVLITCLTNSSYSQSKNKERQEPNTDKIKWYSFEDAYQQIKKKPKKIFVDVYTDWCGWCKKMDAETFTNPVIVNYMSRNYYCVKLNAERKDTVIIDGVIFVNPSPNGRRASHQLAIELLKGQMSYPSYTFMNEKGQILAVVPGYKQAKEFEIWLHYFGDDNYLKTPWEEFRTNFTGEIK